MFSKIDLFITGTKIEVLGTVFGGNSRMSSVKNWLNDIFVSLPDVAENILEELLKNKDVAKKERKKGRSTGTSKRNVQP